MLLSASGQGRAIRRNDYVADQSARGLIWRARNSVGPGATHVLCSVLRIPAWEAFLAALYEGGSAALEHAFCNGLSLYSSIEISFNMSFDDCALLQKEEGVRKSFGVLTVVPQDSGVMF